MRVKYILTVFIVLLIISIGTFGYYKRHASAEKSLNDAQKTTIQLMPLPTIVRDVDGTKDNSLYNLLINKDGQHKIDLKHASIDISKGLQNITWFDLKDLHITFEYDVKNERVNFLGRNSEMDLSGHYEITNKNNIRYAVHIAAGDSQIDIDALYNPNDSEDVSNGLVIGKFELKSNILSKALRYVMTSNGSLGKKEYSLIAKGNFDNKNDKIHFFDVDLVAKDLQMKLGIKVDDMGKVSINGNLEKFDVASMFKHIDVRKTIYSLVSGMVQKMPSSSIVTKFTGTNINYNDTVIKEFILESSSDPANKTFTVSNFKICTEQDSCISTSGAFSRSNFRAQYKGEVISKNLQPSLLVSMFGLDSAGLIANVDIDAEVIVSPGLILFDDVKIKEGVTLIYAPFIKWSAGAESIFNADLQVTNFNEDKPSILRTLFAKHKISFAPDFSSIYSDKEKTIMDVKISFNNSIYGNGAFSNLSFRYLNYPDFVAIQDISSKDPDFGINGSFILGVKDNKPNLDIKLSGGKVDMYKLHNLLSDKNRSEGLNLYLSKLKGIDGRVSLNLSNSVGSVLQSINCNTNFAKDALALNGCKLGVFGGQMLISEGFIDLAPALNYDMKYTIQNMNLKDFLQASNFYLHLPLHASGSANIEVAESSSGKDLAELSKNLSAKFKVKSASDIIVDDFSIDAVTEKYIHKASTPKKAKIKLLSYSVFKEIDGEFLIKNGVLNMGKMYFVTGKNVYGQATLECNLSNNATSGVLNLVGLYEGDKTRSLKLGFDNQGKDKIQFKPMR